MELPLQIPAHFVLIIVEKNKCETHEAYCNSKSKKQLICKSSENDDNCCFRCGREGHYASSCYATKHISKWFLFKIISVCIFLLVLSLLVHHLFLQ